MSAALMHNGHITLLGRDIPTMTGVVEQAKLKFYADNPRIYSLVRDGTQIPEQDDILKSLLQHDHVRQLKDDIVANGGLIDPLIVRAGDMVVLEGNSRLAAYRFLASQDPIAWGKVRCTILPADLDEASIFSLLGQYHVKGKTDWVPYEKAGFVYRRTVEQDADIAVVSAELNIRKNEAEHLVEVYRFMVKHGDRDRDHWSYYDEFLKNRKISKAREVDVGFDKFFAAQVVLGAIPKAIDVRSKLSVVCAGNARNLRRYREGSIGFEDAYENAVEAGGDNLALAKSKRFRMWLARSETEDDILDTSKEVRDRIRFELKEIEKRAGKLKALLEQKGQ